MESSPAPRCSSLPAQVQVQAAVMHHPNFLLRNLFLPVADSHTRRALLWEVSAEPEQRWHEV